MRSIDHGVLNNNEERTHMTTNVYQIWSATSSVPLAVYAGNPDDADLVYREMRNIHYPAWSKDPARLVQVSEAWLAERPQLTAAVNEAKKVPLDWVFYFLGHREGWAPKTTYMVPIGVIAPAEPFVQYYLVETYGDGDQTHVFANSMEDAIQLYIEHFETAYTRCDHAYAITEKSRWLLIGDKTSLREAMDRETVGIAGWDMKEGWNIYPFDHPMAGE